MGFFNFFRKKKKNPKEKRSKEQPIKKKRGGFSLYNAFKRIFFGAPKLDKNLLENIRELLIKADIGTITTEKFIQKLKASGDARIGIEQAIQILKTYTQELLTRRPDTNPVTQETENGVHIRLFVGVNGTGKTTSLAKIAYRLRQEGKNVIISASDTFRAAAVEQVQIWGKRLEVPVVTPTESHKSPAAVVHEALQQALKSQENCYLLIDTAGRLENKTNLMNELGKIRRIIQKRIPEDRQEIFLVIDGSTGQDAWRQAEVFNKALGGITGLIITKLDGVAKGGIVIRIVSELNIPVKYIGLGEKPEDLVPFDVNFFVDQLFENPEESQEG